MIVVYKHFGPQLGNYYFFSKRTYFDVGYRYRSEDSISTLEYLIKHVKR